MRVPQRGDRSAGEDGGAAAAPSTTSSRNSFLVTAPSIELPKGGGAIRGIGEKFGVNPAEGSGSFTVPLVTSPGRAGFSPPLQLTYDSSAGNGPFGFGWRVSLPNISIRTDRGRPRYDGTDVYLHAGADDLVRLLLDDGSPAPDLDEAGQPLDPAAPPEYAVRRYRPRIEGLFARIERWTRSDGDVHWRTITSDNVLTVFGASAGSRIADPAHPERIYSWLVSESRDDKGNAIAYEYRAEDGADVDLTAVHERHRGAAGDPRRTANRYLGRVRYGNRRTALDANGRRPRFLADCGLGPDDWMFELAFDYRDPDPDLAVAEGVERERILAAPPGAWTCRPDPFSVYTPGFEIRTYRRCHRVLTYHNFPDDPAVGRGCLVRALEIGYQNPPPHEGSSQQGYSFVTRLQERRFQRDPPDGDRYRNRPLPPVELEFTRARIGEQVEAVAGESLENLPTGLSGGYRFTDLDGEGLAGALVEQGGAWHYKPSLGEGRLGPTRVVSPLPSTASLASGAQLVDLQGDGALEVADFHPSLGGFFAREGEGGWKPFRAFEKLPNVDWSDPNLRFVDLTGDGLADVLVTSHDAHTVFPSLGEEGFGEGRQIPVPHDEADGPRVVFADGEQSIFLADLSGDGHTDLVRVRSGEVCYWPSLGHGRFGPQVVMAGAPLLDTPDLFDPARIRLADVDGSGTTDLLYLRDGGADIHFNLSGNAWSEPRFVPLPPTARHESVQVADLLGDGTACLVWSSDLPGDAGSPLRHVQLMADGKPHLLHSVVNNLGGRTEIQWAPSTMFYLEDRAAGRPWATKLPFPVHCVVRVTAIDARRKSKFTTSYRYSHGHFDGVERERRGFGRVEVIDTLRVSEFAEANAHSPFITADRALHQPPVMTVTWYHTGAAEDRTRILGAFEQEYFPAQYAARLAGSPFEERILPQPELDPGAGPPLSAAEWREAMRACKGMVLRQEVYELDLQGLEKGVHLPVRIFSAAQHNCHLRRLQPRGPNPHAVFQATESEALTYQYELSLAGDAPLRPDPRVAHTLNLRVDRYGRVEQAVAVGYGRWGTFDEGWAGVVKPADSVNRIREVQAEEHLAYTETHFTAELASPGDHRLPAPCEVLTYELTGVAPADPGHAGPADPQDDYFTPDELRDFRLSETLPGQGSTPVGLLGYHEPAKPAAGPQKRLVEHAATLFFDDALRNDLPLGTPGRLGLTYESYKLALTEPLLQAVLGDKLADGEARQLLAQGGGAAGFLASGYQVGRKVDGSDKTWWLRSNVAGFGPDALQHFCLPDRYTEPFGYTTELTYDADWLYVASSTDPRANQTAVLAFDHRVLSPSWLRDANQNESEAAFDLLGLPVALARKGKNLGTSRETGDTVRDLTFDALNPAPDDLARVLETLPLDGRQLRRWLGKATARFLYHLGETGAPGREVWNVTAPSACSILREQHEGDLPNDPDSGKLIPVQVAFEYGDGSGGVIVKKAQAEPEVMDGPIRWIASGKTVLNNKGKPVLQYEPYFSEKGGVPDHRFEDPRQVGVATALFYDAVGRLMRTEAPDGTLQKVEFTPWLTRAYDPNDAVLESRWYEERGSPDPTGRDPASLDSRRQDERAAWLSAQHAGTPAVTVLDSLGREVISVAHNRVGRPGAWADERYVTHIRLDAEGKPLWIRDARANLVMQYVRRGPPRDPALTINQEEPEEYTPAYDIAGNLLFQHSMDAGDRWMLAAAAGKPMLAWDENERSVERIGGGVDLVPEERRFRTEYDELHRPTRLLLRVDRGADEVVERFTYLDTADLARLLPVDRDEKLARNLVGQAVEHRDPSGVATVERIDREGQPEEVTRRLVGNPSPEIVDWNGGGPKLDDETYRQITLRDALGRMTLLYNWHIDDLNGECARVAVYEPEYCERGSLRAEKLHVRASKTRPGGVLSFAPDRARSTRAIDGIEWNARGQKTAVKLGNGITTHYNYDDKSFRLVSLYVQREGDPQPPLPDGRAGLQNIQYTYDAAGNIVRMQDLAVETVWFNSQRVDATATYEYDALDRLVWASGREKLNAPRPVFWEGYWPAGARSTDDQLANYEQTYTYDETGNITRMHHQGGVPWTRDYDIVEDSNRLKRTEVGPPPVGTSTYRHDTHGNMLNLADTSAQFDLRWDWRDMIREVDLGGGGRAHYSYDIGKQRTRKHIVRDGNDVQDRIYLGGYERFRRYVAGRLVEEIESHHLFEGEERVLLVDDVITPSTADRPRPDRLTVKAQTLFRYQHANHLGSVQVETNESAKLVSWEEFHPYGTSAYRLTNKAIEAPPRRYRYTGMERDEESGATYHHTRAYQCGLGRWLSCDSSGTGAGLNIYEYAGSRPTNMMDRSGRVPNLGLGHSASLSTSEKEEKANAAQPKPSDAGSGASDAGSPTRPSGWFESKVATGGFDPGKPGASYLDAFDTKGPGVALQGSGGLVSDKDGTSTKSDLKSFSKTQMSGALKWSLLSRSGSGEGIYLCDGCYFASDSASWDRTTFGKWRVEAMSANASLSSGFAFKLLEASGTTFSREQGIVYGDWVLGASFGSVYTMGQAGAGLGVNLVPTDSDDVLDVGLGVQVAGEEVTARINLLGASVGVTLGAHLGWSYRVRVGSTTQVTAGVLSAGLIIGGAVDPRPNAGWRALAEDVWHYVTYPWAASPDPYDPRNIIYGRLSTLF